jgi:hypothetical protein
MLNPVNNRPRRIKPGSIALRIRKKQLSTPNQDADGNRIIYHAVNAKI